jgi:hypothetical protein
MANTPRMGWPLVSEFRDPWIRDFNQLVTAQENSAFAAREDRHLIMRGGGTFTFSAIANTIEWEDVWEMLAAISGFLWRIQPPTSPIDLEDGETLYAELVRRPTNNVNVPVAAASQVPSSDAHIALAFRKGDKVYFRNGAVLDDGVPANVIENPSGAGDFDNLPLATNESTDQATFQVIGSFELDATEHDSVQFSTVANVTDGALTGEIQLFNLTDAGAVITHTYPGTLTPASTVSAVLSLPAGPRLYEVRHRVTGGTPPNDRIVTSWAGFKID